MRALLSVSDKTGLVELGRGLIDHGVELVSTGGTARALSEAGLATTGISDVTGFPEMMDGRVKTLHPAVHGGILARRDRPDDLDAIRGQGIHPIDIVVVNLYPFAQAAAAEQTTFDELIEQIDIGGPSMVRAAAKNFRDVVIVVDPADYPRVLTALDRDQERDEDADTTFRFELAQKAFAHTATYDMTIAAALAAARQTTYWCARPSCGIFGTGRIHTNRRRCTPTRDGGSGSRRYSRGRRCRSRICWTWTPPHAWRWSLPSRWPWSSSTRTRAVWPPPHRRVRPM